MNQKLFQVRAFITYWLHAVDAHSLHSPFFYDFYTRIIRYHHAGDSSFLPVYREIEDARRTLLKNETEIEVLDLGAGTKGGLKPRRKISDIARRSLSSSWYSQLYHRAVVHYHAANILELGTSLGVNTMYLAAHRSGHVTTFEGSPEIARRAASLFAEKGFTNITVVPGNIDDTLAGVVSLIPRVDFVFVDANHRHAPTLRYFERLLPKVHERSVIVFDDIHSSAGMQAAWHEIRQHARVTGSADLFRCGFVFFDPSLNRQHLVLQT